MSNVITDMGIGIPTGLSKVDKQRLVDITNNADSNNDSIKTSMISHVNNKAKTSLPNNSTWGNIENAIDGISIEDMDGEEIDTDKLQIVSDRFNTIMSNNDLSNIKYITSDNKYITIDGKKYDSDMNLIKSIPNVHFDFKDKNDNFYMIDFINYTATYETSGSSNLYNYTINMMLKKYDSNFNLILNKNFSFHLGSFEGSINEGVVNSTIEYLDSICTNSYTYIFMRINWELIFIKFDLNCSNKLYSRSAGPFYSNLAEDEQVFFSNRIYLYSNDDYVFCKYYSNTGSFGGTDFHVGMLISSNDDKIYDDGGDNNKYQYINELYFIDHYLYASWFSEASDSDGGNHCIITRTDLSNFTTLGDYNIIFEDFNGINYNDRGPWILLDNFNNIILLNQTNQLYYNSQLNNKHIYSHALTTPLFSNKKFRVLLDKEGNIIFNNTKLQIKIKYKIIE